MRYAMPTPQPPTRITALGQWPSAIPNPSAATRAPVYDGCRRYRYGPVVTRRWSGWITTIALNSPPRWWMDQARSASPAHMTTRPDASCASGDPGRAPNGSRAIRTAATNATPTQASSTAMLPPSWRSPRPRRWSRIVGAATATSSSQIHAAHVTMSRNRSVPINCGSVLPPAAVSGRDGQWERGHHGNLVPDRIRGRRHTHRTRGRPDGRRGHPPLRHRQHRRLERVPQPRPAARGGRGGRLVLSGPAAHVGGHGPDRIPRRGGGGRGRLGGRLRLVVPARVPRRPGGRHGDGRAGGAVAGRHDPPARPLRHRRPAPAAGAGRAARAAGVPRLAGVRLASLVDRRRGGAGGRARAPEAVRRGARRPAGARRSDGRRTVRPAGLRPAAGPATGGPQ